MGILLETISGSRKSNIGMPRGDISHGEEGFIPEVTILRGSGGGQTM